MAFQAKYLLVTEHSHIEPYVTDDDTLYCANLRIELELDLNFVLAVQQSNNAAIALISYEKESKKVKHIYAHDFAAAQYMIKKLELAV